jgi:hypothetical protein
MNIHTELQLSSPDSLGRVVNEGLGEVPLYTTDHVVTIRLPSFADDTKCVILHDRRATDSSEETLLHSALELQDCDFR